MAIIFLKENRNFLKHPKPFEVSIVLLLSESGTGAPEGSQRSHQTLPTVLNLQALRGRTQRALLPTLDHLVAIVCSAHHSNL